MAIAPLKTVAPFTLTVDRSTGYASASEGLSVDWASKDAAMTRAFLAQYVLNREGFDASDAKAAAERVSNWSAGTVRSQYVRSLGPDGPLGSRAGAKLLVTVKEIDLLPAGAARVRFEVERRAAGEYAGERRPYAAAVGFRSAGAPARIEDRLINPLGFQVTSYRRDAEMFGVATAP